jgi:hypothetical protein
MVNRAKTLCPLAHALFLKFGARVRKNKKNQNAENYYPALVIRLSGPPCLSTLTGMKRTTTERGPRPRRARAHARKRARVRPKPIVYGAAWGRWIMRNVERDLRSGALRVNAEGATIH